MRVEDVMSKNVYFCNPSMNLAEAVDMMWTDDCGALPVVNESGNVVGMITDRDICIALGTRAVNAGALRVGDVFVPRLFSCEPGDDIHKALATMTANKVRRLPVIDSRGTLQGIVSIDDMVLNAETIPKTMGGLCCADVLMALKVICQPRQESQAAAING
jgi:CBS domain-containing protein